MFIKIPLLVITLLLSAVCAFGQYGGLPNNWAEIARMENERLRGRERETIRIAMANLDRLQSPESRNQVYKTVFKRERLNVEDRKIRGNLVFPDIEDVKLHRDFLQQPKTGIFRLFTDNDCLAGNVIKTDGKCKNVFPGTWFYSFREKDYSDNLFFDIFLRNGKIIADSLMAQGILVKLGNFSLDNVNLQSPGAGFLVDFKPAVKGTEIGEQYVKINQGVEADGYKYSKEVEAKVGNVYLLRVVAYRLQRKFLADLAGDAANPENLKFILLDQDKRNDMTVAFRIVRKDAAGNLTIIWKELARKGAPEAEFN